MCDQQTQNERKMASYLDSLLLWLTFILGNSGKRSFNTRPTSEEKIYAVNDSFRCIADTGRKSPTVSSGPKV